MKIILIDNYDSFTYNVSEYLYLLKQSATIVRNDKFNLNIIKKFDKIIISPGPGGPNDAGKCLEVVNKYYKLKPILGICLGHQIIGQSLGGKVVRAKKLCMEKLAKYTIIRKEFSLIYQKLLMERDIIA